MKMRLEWFIAPCVASMIGGSGLSLNAQDAPKGKRNLNVIIDHTKDGVDSDGIRAKVAKELEKSGISEEAKARILKDVENALSNAKKTAAKTKTIVEKELKQAKTDAKDAGKDAKDQVKWTIQSPANTGSFSTQFFASPKGDGYRIGIQCSAVEAEDGEEVAYGKLGLEVQAVVDDSPAKKAGIVEGDFLMSVNGTKVVKIVDLTNAVQEAGKAGKEVTIEVKRDDKVVEVMVKPTKMKSADVELENIRLSLPTGGFVFDADALSGQMKERMKKYVMPEASGGEEHVIRRVQNDSVDLKKEMAELRSEMADLKKLLKEMIDKK